MPRSSNSNRLFPEVENLITTLCPGFRKKRIRLVNGMKTIAVSKGVQPVSNSEAVYAIGELR